MIYKQETYARELYKNLQEKFAGKDFDISLKGAGVHWDCTISYGVRQCIIHCFDINFTNFAYKGPEYYTSFKENEKEDATGRTFNEAQTISSVNDWLENKTLAQLYSRYDFIDEKKRQLEKIREEIIVDHPQVLQLQEIKVVQELFSMYSLWFRNADRSCRVYYYGYEENPRYIFHWDNAEIFQTTGPDQKRIGRLIKEWVYDRTAPSVLKKEFTEIDFGKLSDFYEAGKGVEGEFIMSWDGIEQFYRVWHSDKKYRVLELIKVMREKGFDKLLRAGTALNTFVLSRSRHHGLRENQKSITFSFEYTPSAMCIYTDNGEKRNFDTIAYNEEIEQLLKQLCQEAID